MEKQNSLQLELFSAGQKDYNQLKLCAAHNSFFRYIRNYEKIIMLIIGLVITGIISFSLGVEKGKRLAQSTQIVPQQIKPESVDALKNQVQPKIEKPELVKPSAPADSPQYYTIQLASYQNTALARKEAQDLKKKGLLPLVLTKGRYTVLCVGNFTNKETARSLLSELRKRYRDCFLRRL